MKIKFMINRLKRMSISEVLYRMNLKLASEIEKRRLKASPSFEITGSGFKLFKASPGIVNRQAVIGLADKLCENKMDLFALKDLYLGEQINYHRDYKSGKAAPGYIYGKSIDYRNEAKIGDIKYIWELNRQLYLVPLALSCKITGNGKYLTKLEFFISEWLEQNPPLLGVNWASSLELGIRLIGWSLCWQLAGEGVSLGLKYQWLKSIYMHCRFIDRNYSRFSSANNHLIGEAAGLFIACIALPGFKETERWRKRAYDILVEECARQNYEDGVNKEQALSYQQFVLDFLVLAALAGKAAGIEFPADYWFRIEKMLVFLSAIRDASGGFPHIGDEDDGYAVELLQREYGPYRSLLNTGAYLLGREDFLQPDCENDIKTSFLLSIAGIEKTIPKRQRKAVPNKFEQGGYYLLGKDFGTPFEEKMIFDCGPLGYLSLAAHGHADALSFVFSAGGNQIFIDPGTFAYHTNARWRSYFRGTAAHNTAVIDNKDQSAMTGSFMWGKRANAKLLGYREPEYAAGSHDGYMALEDPVLHLRKVLFEAQNRRWTITDEFICRGKHSVSLNFHIHPGCNVKMVENRALIDFKAGVVNAVFEKSMALSLHMGESDPITGWYSPSYDVRLETNTLKLQGTISGNSKIVTSFEVNFR